MLAHVMRLLRNVNLQQILAKKKMSEVVFEVPFASQTGINLQDAFFRYRQKKQVRATTSDGKGKVHPKVTESSACEVADGRTC